MWRRYARLWGPNPAADVDDELRFHLDAKIDDLVAQGWSRNAARIEAERQFGDLNRVREVGERVGNERERTNERKDFWGAFRQDLTFAIRTLRKDRGFTVITVLILALGIAANTAVFSVVNTVLLRPLPLKDPERLVWFSSGRASIAKGRPVGGLSGTTYTVDALDEFRRNNHSFQEVTAYNPYFGNSDYTLLGKGEPKSASGVLVAEDFFPMLGVEPMLGRHFTKEECQSGGSGAVILSYGFWKNEFGGEPGIVGQAITLNKKPVIVAGVLPATFDFGALFSPGTKIDLFAPAVLNDMRRWGNTLSLVGRLAPGVSMAQAQAESDVLFPQLAVAHKWWGDYTTNMSELKNYVTGKLRRSLIVLWSAVGLILLIVCVNLSNLIQSRATARTKEFALRSALGAGRGRIVRQLLTESFVLSGCGALLGLAMAYALTRYIAHQGSIALPLLSSISVDGQALLWTLGITMTVAIVFGLAPALKIGSKNLQLALKDSGAGMTVGRTHERVRAVMVVSEVALACVLLVGAGLLLRSFVRLLDVDLGFNPSRAAVIRVTYDDQNSSERRGVVLQEMLRNVSNIPGVEAAGIADMLPLGRNRAWGLAAKGVVYPKEERDSLSATVRIVTPGYLGAMGMHIRNGRDFDWNDQPKSEPVIIVNQAAARKFWHMEDPVGQMARMNNADTKVIAVIADVREHGLEAAPGPEMYLPVTQAWPSGAELVIRTRLAPESLGPAVMRTLRELNPAQPAAEFRPLQQIVDRSVSPRKFFMMLVASFAGLGLILASLGIYGVISYSVTRQTQEIGIRMALGATAPQVQRSIVVSALGLTAIGVAVGSVAALAVGKWIESMLYGTSPTDPLTYLGIVALLGLVAFVAGYIPARRASRIDPMIALRTS